VKRHFVSQVLWPTVKFLIILVATATVVFMSKVIDNQRTYIQQLEEVIDARDCEYPERSYRAIPQPPKQHTT